MHNRNMRSVFAVVGVVLWVHLCCTLTHAGLTNTASKVFGNDPDRKLLRAVPNLLNIAAQLSVDFNKTVEEELGISYVQELYNSFKYTTVPQDFEQQVASIARNLETKLADAVSLLHSLSDSYSSNCTGASCTHPSVVAPCDTTSSIGSFNVDDVKEAPPRRSPSSSIGAIERMLAMYPRLGAPVIKQVYYLSASDVENPYGANAGTAHACRRQSSRTGRNAVAADDSLLWGNYMHSRQSSSNRSRYLMLLLDHGGSLSRQQLNTVKLIGRQMISMLKPSDHIGVLALADDYRVPELGDQCAPQSSSSMLRNIGGSNHDSAYVLAPATRRNKRALVDFVNSLTRGSGGTNHSYGFQKALQTVRRSSVPTNETVMLLYVSRGLLSSIADAKPVLETIARGLAALQTPVVINTCAVVDESKPILFETQFLRDIAVQNYSQYNVLETLASAAHPGILLIVNSSQSVGLTVVRLFHMMYSSDSLESQGDTTVHIPKWDNYSKDLSVSITIASKLGLFGVDLYLTNLAEEVTYFSNFPNYAYAFIVDRDGVAITYPSYPRPLMATGQWQFVDIRFLERLTGFDTVRVSLLEQHNGSKVLSNENNQAVRYVWQQVHVEGRLWYTVCVVVFHGVPAPRRPSKVHWFPTTETSSIGGAGESDTHRRSDSSTSHRLLHYRLDLMPATSAAKLCMHLNQVATLDAGTLFLSAGCFKSPSTYIHTLNQSPPHSPTFFGNNSSSSSPSSSPAPLIIQKCMAYITDNTRLMSNPGLREHIRDDVAAQAHVLQYLRNQHLAGPRAQYIVRRYVTSASGVLQMYPGGLMAARFDPTRRPWFQRATAQPHRTVLTSPYVDAAGAGYIVTVAYATRHVVVAMDVTLGYVYRMMLETMPFCRTELTCLLMDDGGYLIYHPNLVDPNGAGAVERQHIVHREPFVAADMLNHANFVRKEMCSNYADETLQRYYRLNSSVEPSVLTNAVHGEHCIRYQIAPIAGTNLFVSAINTTCPDISSTFFCPCSIVDRRCLNCNRMEQRECECPCECPLQLDTCSVPSDTNASYSAGLSHIQSSPPLLQRAVCESSMETTSWMDRSSSSAAYSASSSAEQLQLQQCVMPVACEHLMTYDECVGVIGCDWCRYDVDGEPLKGRPFCTALTACFGGKLGARTPYDVPPMMMGDEAHFGEDGDEEEDDGEEMLTAPDGMVDDPDAEANSAGGPNGAGAGGSGGGTYTTMGGPIVSAVIGMGVVLSALFVCHRSYTAATHADNFYLTAAHDNQVRMSDLNVSDDNHEYDRHHYQDRLLRNGGNGNNGAAPPDGAAAVIASPYSVYGAGAGGAGAGGGADGGRGAHHHHYRRHVPVPVPHGGTTTDSDHGYSTMTPQEDSERASAFALDSINAGSVMTMAPTIGDDDDHCGDIADGADVCCRCDLETAIVGNDVSPRPRPVAFATAAISPKDYRPPPPPSPMSLDATGATSLGGGRNCIMAPVTVHRHMETSQL